MLRNIVFSKIEQAFILSGLASAKWRGRLQRLDAGELVELLPEGSEIWLDGGHNAAAGAMLAGWIKQQEKPVHVVCAMTQLKDASAFLLPIASVAASITITTIPNEPLSMNVESLLSEAQALRPNARFSDDIKGLIRENESGSVVLMCGSLYFAGSILEKNS